MTSYPETERRTLSSSHQDMILRGSGVDPGVEAERGYETIKSRADLLEFKKYQRRPGLRIPMYSPDGITRSSQLRPDRPRFRDGKAIKYETAGGSECILDVHPSMQEEARGGDGDLYITEGIKKADALTSRGLCTVGIIGVWNWQRGGEMLPCWDHIRLDGRRVYVVFDSDVMVKPEVQLALERLVAALEGRGATVMVVYLPQTGDDKTGVDDYLVDGGTVSELKMLARKYEPSDIGKIRLSKDAKLQATIEDLERRFWSGEWKGQGGHSDRDIALKLIEAAKRHGKVVADGIHVVKSWGTLELEAKVSRRTLAKAFNRLEERGFCYRDYEGRERDKAGAFVLRASVNHYGGKPGHEGNATQGLQACDRGGLHLRSPRLRWSRPKFTPKRGTVAGTRKVRQGLKLEARDRIERLGKVRGAILDVLDARGGTATLQEIADALHRKRARDIRRRNLPMLEEAGIITVEDGRVSLTDNWLEALEEQRLLGGEVEADKTAKEKLRTRRQAYHARDKVEPSPHWTNNPEADGSIEDLKGAGDLPLEDREVLKAVLEFEKKFGRYSFKWNQVGAKELFYSVPGDHWPTPDQLRRIREHIEAATGVSLAA